MAKKSTAKSLRKAAQDALTLRLDALDAVLHNRSGDNIRYSMYTEQKLMEAIEAYHSEQV